MKKVLISGLVAAAFGFMGAVQAQTVDQPFNVTATVVAKCIADNGTTVPEVAFGAVDAFASATAQASIKFLCTRGLAPSGAVIDDTAGVVAGFAFSLQVDGGSKTDGSNATATSAAVGDTWTYVVDGTIAADQAGDTAAATSVGRTLTVSF